MKFTTSNENLQNFFYPNQTLARKLPKASTLNKPKALKQNMLTLKNSKASIILLTVNLSKDNQSQLMALAKFHEVTLVVINKRNDEEEFLKLHLESGIKVIRVNKIMHLKAFSNYTYFYLTDIVKPIVSAKPLKYFAEQLNAFNFIRPHRSHLVNKYFIQSYSNENGHCITLKNGETIAISRRKLKAVLEQL